MVTADHCQERALVLMAVAKESAQFKEQMSHLAHIWLTLAALDETLGAWAKQAEQRLHLASINLRKFVAHRGRPSAPLCGVFKTPSR
jgi:hypothetical protein